MAHNIRPQHRPHEQLRTEAPTQRKHTDKYVSAFVSSDNYVDMSFQSPLLQDSADHYRVGIDEFTVSLSNLSILEHEGVDKVLFQIRRLGYFGDAYFNVNRPEAQRQYADANDPTYEPDDDERTGSVSDENNRGLESATAARALQFRIDRQYNSIAEISQRMDEICQALRTMVRDMQNPDDYDHTDPATFADWNLESDPAEDPGEYLAVEITTGGLLRFRGCAHFWANFVIEIPDPKYQYLLLGQRQQYIALDTINGQPYDPYPLGEDYDPENDIIFVVAPREIELEEDNLRNLEAPLTTFLSFTGQMCLFKSLDRRVAVEVGCSLPLKNSPMFDHGAESPDFVIGRYFLQNDTSSGLANMGGTLGIDVPPLGPKQLCGPKDRVCYHHLGPQQKIQTLRLRLWARVRSYDAAQDKWGMKTIQMPVRGSDYWHIKLHFRPKDGRY